MQKIGYKMTCLGAIYAKIFPHAECAAHLRALSLPASVRERGPSIFIFMRPVHTCRGVPPHRPVGLDPRLFVVFHE